MNVLVLGLDRRPDEGSIVRSDVLMLVSVRSMEPQLVLVSIPRDLYVEIPGHGAGRINTAHFWGEQEREGGGPALAVQAVSSSFRVSVDHFVRVDFDGFRKIIDAVGGIDVAVENGLVDDAYPTEGYGTTRIEIPAGLQRMDGETALRYVRSRHASSDFDRAARQQQVVIALAERLSDPRTWIRMPGLTAVAIGSVDTDLSSWAFAQLALTALRVGPEGIQPYVIDQDMIQPWTTPTGGAVLLPRWEAIDPLVAEVFGR
ncbi:MAG: LCP family protein [Anaerolineae bacterium]|jgi:LCP family protein required for cell wall assembly